MYPGLLFGLHVLGYGLSFAEVALCSILVRQLTSLGTNSLFYAKVVRVVSFSYPSLICVFMFGEA